MFWRWRREKTIITKFRFSELNLSEKHTCDYAAPQNWFGETFSAVSICHLKLCCYWKFYSLKFTIENNNHFAFEFGPLQLEKLTVNQQVYFK